MPGRLKSTKFFRQEAGKLSENLSGAKTIVRDWKNISVGGPNDSLVLKRNPGHMKYAQAFYQKLREIGFKHLKIVPVKQDIPNGVQKYFHRPSLRAMKIYLSWSLAPSGLFHPNNRIERPGEEDIRLCQMLCRKYPKISQPEWLRMVVSAESELRLEAKVGDLVKFAGSQRLFKFGFGNFILLGLTREGIPKVGLVDV